MVHQQIELLFHAVELLLLFLDTLAEAFHLCLDLSGLLFDGFELAFGDQLAPHQVTREIFLVRGEAKIQLFVESGQRGARDFCLAREFAGFVAQQLTALSILLERKLHFPNCLPELQVGFFDAIEYRVEVRLEQTGQSVDQGHGFTPFVKHAGILVGYAIGQQAAFGKTRRRAFTKNLRGFQGAVLGLKCVQSRTRTMAPKPRLLIVEDEAAIRSGLVDVFVYHGYEVDTAEHGDDGLRKSLSGRYDMILLDVMLPGVDGFEICERIRQQDRQQPVIMLTAKSGDDDIVHGLTLGADDYVAKPFSVTQLVLRVQAVLRRAGIGERPEREIRLANGLVADTENLCAGDTAFTRREMDLLVYLAQHCDRPVPREELLARVWGYANHLEIETRTVDIHVAKLRRKIEADPASPRPLVTVRGAGYRLLVAEP